MSVSERINDDLTLFPMTDKPKFNIQLNGDKHYVVHFLNPKVVGDEFVMLHRGDNIFKRIKNEKTESYFFDDTQLRNIVTGVELKKVEPKQNEMIIAGAQPPTGKVSPCTGPIIIPPRHSGA